MQGVYGETENVRAAVPKFVAGVYGAGISQPGVIGFSRDNDGAQGLSFAGTAVRAASFFGPVKRGRAVVRLDADFAKVIKRGDYRVFVTPEGDCRGLYIHNRSAASFEVRELAGGTSNVAFSYRIVGRRKDIRRHRRFAKIDTRLQLPADATRPPRKGAPRAAELRAFVARLEKEARARAPKGAKKARHPFPEHLKREAVIAAESARSMKRDQ
jgi:hypothetical protein